MDRIFKPRKVFFSLLSVVFLQGLISYTANRLDENEPIQFFELSWPEGTSVHMLGLACAAGVIV